MDLVHTIIAVNLVPWSLPRALDDSDLVIFSDKESVFGVPLI